MTKIQREIQGHSFYNQAFSVFTLPLLVVQVFLCFLLKRNILFLLAKDCKLAMLSLVDGICFNRFRRLKIAQLMFMYSDDKLLGELYEPTKQTALIINNLRIKQQWLKMDNRIQREAVEVLKKIQRSGQIDKVEGEEHGARLKETYRAGKASEKELLLFFSDSVFMSSFFVIK